MKHGREGLQQPVVQRQLTCGIFHAGRALALVARLVQLPQLAKVELDAWYQKA